jgi:hypothetical protein
VAQAPLAFCTSHCLPFLSSLPKGKIQATVTQRTSLHPRISSTHSVPDSYSFLTLKKENIRKKHSSSGLHCVIPGAGAAPLVTMREMDDTLGVAKLKDWKTLGHW